MHRGVHLVSRLVPPSHDLMDLGISGSGVPGDSSR